MAKAEDAVLLEWFVEQERRQGTALLEELHEGHRTWDDLSQGERRLLSVVSLVDLVLERSRQVRFEDPGAMIEWAQKACVLADHFALEDPNGGPVSAPGARARAWAELGNAYRVADDLENAEQALDYARRLAQGPGVASDTQLRVLELMANLSADLRSFSEARELLVALEKAYRRRGAGNKLASILIKLGLVQTDDNEPSTAIFSFLRAMEVLEPGDPLVLAAVHGLGIALVEASMPEVAQALVASNRRLYRKAGRLNEIRLFWLEGKIASALDQPGLAEAKLNTARLAFLRRDKFYDSALVSLDLALLYARQGRRQALLYLVEQMLATFRRLGIAREAIASLLLVKQSCQGGASLERLCGQIEAQVRILPEIELRMRLGKGRGTSSSNGAGSEA